jgi:hypothetical protein
MQKVGSVYRFDFAVGRVRLDPAFHDEFTLLLPWENYWPQGRRRSTMSWHSHQDPVLSCLSCFHCRSFDGFCLLSRRLYLVCGKSPVSCKPAAYKTGPARGTQRHKTQEILNRICRISRRDSEKAHPCQDYSLPKPQASQRTMSRFLLSSSRKFGICWQCPKN